MCWIDIVVLVSWNGTRAQFIIVCQFFFRLIRFPLIRFFRFRSLFFPLVHSVIGLFVLLIGLLQNFCGIFHCGFVHILHTKSNRSVLIGPQFQHHIHHIGLNCSIWIFGLFCRSTLWPVLVLIVFISLSIQNLIINEFSFTNQQMMVLVY